MSQSDLTQKDRTSDDTTGASAKPFSPPPLTQSQYGSETDIHANKTYGLPRSAYFIIFVEGCERFCFYGLKTILLLYFMQFLLLDKDSATVGYHLFSSACYFTPVLGAIISDGFIGRYWTIVSLSIIYFIGTFVLTITAIPPIGGKKLVGPAIGLLLVAFGTGGIKPCVSAFGADQLSMSNPRQLSRYFSFFYFAINCGSLISTVTTPLLRSKFHCYGYDCYSLAFGVPSLLMLLAITLFIAGTSLYKRVPPRENIIFKFVAIVARAIRNAICGPSSQDKAHWLDHADEKYSANDIEDVRSVFRVFLLFTPIPIFYALFNQSGSRWTYQASLMNGSLGPLGTIQPDQMQALNSLFVLLFIPIFEGYIYPAFARCNLLIKPLQRMFCGMLVMLLAFVAAAIVQKAIESKAEAIPIRFDANIFNAYNCPILINDKHLLQPKQVHRYSCIDLLDKGIVLNPTCTQANITYKLAVDELCPSILVLSEPVNKTSATNVALLPLSNSIIQQRGVQEYALLRLVTLDSRPMIVEILPNKYIYNITERLTPTDYQSVLPTEYRATDLASKKSSVDRFEVRTTAVYTAVIYTADDAKLRTMLFEDVPPFTVHILWQTIQYVLMTSAEMLVSITGLVFAYSQAPRRYKTVIMSAWLLTSAFGDLIVVLVAQVQLVKNQTSEFILFAFLMAFAAFLFGILAIHYKEYKQNDEEDSEDQQLILDKNAPEPDDAIPLSK